MADSPLQGRLITVIGGGGFIGRHLAQELLARGARLRVACRHPERAFAVKPLGNLGTVQFVPCDLAKPATIAPALAGAELVVNLAGSFAGPLDAMQGRGLAALGKSASEAGVKALVHLSAIGADADSPVAYARTKAEGEAALRATFPASTVLRPSVLFGPDDNFLNMFGALMAMPVLPVFAPTARFQPVFVDDVVLAICAALEQPARAAGQTFDLAGPEVLTMLELNRRIATATARQPLLIEMPDVLSATFATLTGWLPGAPLSRAQWTLLKAGNVASGTLPGLADLGVQPRPVGLLLDRWMQRFREHGRFGAKAPA